MATKVSSIKIAGFRGATVPVEIRFDQLKPVALVFGENGTGKSTLADAFDFVCNRQYGSLSHFSFSIGEQPRNYVPSLGRASSAVSVQLTAGDQTWTGSLGPAGASVTPVGPPDAQILRRPAILRLIEARAKDRFEAFRHFIDVPLIEKAEKALREAWNAEKTVLDEAVRGLGQSEDALERLWAADGNPGTSAIEWAVSESVKDVAGLDASVQQASDLERGYEQASGALSTLNKAAADLEAARQDRLAAEVKQNAVEAKHATQSSELLGLLRDAQGFVARHTAAKACPVCEQDVDPTALVASLAERIDGMQELGASVSAVHAAQQVTTSTQTVADQRRKDLCASIRALGCGLRDTILVQVTPLASLWQGEANFLSSGETTEAHEAHALVLWRQLSTVRSALKAGLESDRKSLIQHNAITGQAKTHKECDLRAKASERLAEQLKAALDVVSGQRKQYVEEVLTEISEEVGDLYAKLHPDEEIGRVRFFLNPAFISSLEFDGKFHGKEVSPQAYYSESHLDTLGICVFLALAKRFRTDQTIVVLDDVLTSVDAAHLKRFMALLHEEAVHFNQVVVLTHYRPWRDQYRWAKGDAANTQVIELGPWTLTGGLNAFDFVADLAALGNALAHVPFDRQVVASKGGIALESLLDFITLKYRCRVPRNARNEYTPWGSRWWHRF